MKLLTLLFPLLLAGCAADLVAKTPRIPNDPELIAAKQQYKTCLRKELPRYDDGRTDTSTIAGMMVGVCNPEYDFWYHNFIKGMPKGDRKALARQREHLQRSTVADLVAEGRSATPATTLAQRYKDTPLP